MGWSISQLKQAIYCLKLKLGVRLKEVFEFDQTWQIILD